MVNLRRFCFVIVVILSANPAVVLAEPAHHESIEWVTANSNLVVVGKVIKAERAGKHDVITVRISEVLRNTQEAEPESTVTFLVQEYCSRYAQDWMNDGLPMIFFLVKLDGAKREDTLPAGYDWVLHDSGNGSSAVLLGKTNRQWPGTIDVFTKRFDYLTRPDHIIRHVRDYAASIPPLRVEESTELRVPYSTNAYARVFPPEGPGNLFALRVPIVVEDNRVAKQFNIFVWSLIAALVVGVISLECHRRFASQRPGSPR